MAHELIAGSKSVSRRTNAFRAIVTVRFPNPDVLGGYEETKHFVPGARDRDTRRLARNDAQLDILENREYYQRQHDLEYDMVRALDEERLKG